MIHQILQVQALLPKGKFINNLVVIKEKNQENKEIKEVKKSNEKNIDSHPFDPEITYYYGCKH